MCSRHLSAFRNALVVIACFGVIALATDHALAQQSTQPGEPRFSPEVQALRAAARAAGVPEHQLPLRTKGEIRALKANGAAWRGKVNGFVLDRIDTLQAFGVLTPDERHNAPAFATEEVAIDERGRLKVECRVDDEMALDDRYFNSIGGTLVDRAVGYGLLIAWVPAEQIATLAARPDVRRIMEVDPPRCNTGSVLSQGDAIHRANIVRDLLGITGAGQKVGAISDGVTNLAAAQATGDLPGTVDVPADCTGSGDEGTAMLEIIHDLAPDADLAFCGVGGGATTFINAINKLVAAGCTIITDDLIAGAEPLYENGPVANAKIGAVNAGVYYTCSAGNRGNQHYHANFNCTGSNITFGPNTFDCPHDFGGGDRRLSITLAASNSIRLQWAEPFGGAGIDLDLYILDDAGNILASSTDLQDGDDDPQEAVNFGAVAGTSAHILIEHFGGGVGGTDVFFDVRAFGSVGWNEYLIREGSLDPVARQPEVHVDGAANAASPNTVAGFSSRGPALRFFPAPATFLKPDAISINGVSVTGAGCFACPSPCPPQMNCTFFGTSASTPHAAAIAALVLQVNPGLIPPQVMTRLDTNAIDIDAPGNDNNAGWGRLDALRAVLDCANDNSAPTLESCSFPGGTVDPQTCELTIPFSFTVEDDRCIQADDVTFTAQITSGGATNLGGLSTKTQVSPTEVLVEGTVTVSGVTACPVVVSLNITATDCCDNVANLVCASGNIVDVTPPVFTTCSATGGQVDDNCEYVMPFSATVTDACCVNAADVSAVALVVTNNATLSNLTVNKVQANQGRVDVTGSVLVSQLTSCPATVRITFSASDCCGNAAQDCIAEADVVDLIPPVIVCPPDITLERGDKICNDDVQNWLDSATATDNCDTDVEIVNDAPPCGFACGTTTLVTWTATDDCGNQSQCSASITIKPCPIGTPSQKGTVLIFPNVEVKWNLDGTVRQDTFISLSNDQTEAVHVNLFFVNGDDAIPGEPGCNYVKVNADLTKSQPIFFSAATGLPFGISGFKLLDPGPPPGRPDPEDPTARVLRGFLVVVATNPLGNEIRWNHLHGEATIVDYARSAAWEYGPWAFQNRCVPEGAELLDCILFDAAGVCCDAIVIPGNLDFDAFQLDLAPGRLLLNFIAANATAFSGAGRVVKHDTDLTLLPLNQDLRQDGLPHRTKVDALVWNGNEISFAAVPRCVNCWDQRLLSAWSAIFLRQNLQTDAGRARWDGVASSQCPGSTPAALLGVANKVLTFDATDVTYSGANLQGLGSEKGNIKYDPLEPPEENAGGQ